MFKVCNRQRKEESQKVAWASGKWFFVCFFGFFFFFWLFLPKGMDLVFSVETQAIEVNQ